MLLSATRKTSSVVTIVFYSTLLCVIRKESALDVMKSDLEGSFQDSTTDEGNQNHKEYFQEDYLKLDNHQCSEYLCGNKGLCEKNISGNLCSCMKSCTEFGNCCLDYFQSCMKIELDDIPHHVDNSFLYEEQDSSPQPINIDLLKNFGICKFYKNIGYVNVIGKCPKTSDSASKLELSCKTRSGLLPLTYSGNPILNFANIHCALCHGVQVTLLKAWNFSYICPDNEDCERIFEFNQYDETVCYPNDMTKTAGELLGNLRTLCYSYIKPVMTVNMTVERNVHCALIKGFTLPSLSQYQCSDNSGSNMETESIRVLFDINNEEFRSSDNQNCPNGEIFDTFFDLCRPFICPLYQYHLNGRCYKNHTVFMDIQDQPFPYRNKSVLVNFTYYSVVDDGKIDSPTLGKGLKIIAYTGLGTTDKPPAVCENKKEKPSDERYLMVTYTVMIENYRYTLGNFLGGINRMSCVTNITAANFKHQDLNSSQCKNSTIESVLDAALKTISGVDFAVVQEGDQEFYYDLRSIAFKLNATRYNASERIDQIHVCAKAREEFNKSCKILIFNAGEFELAEDKGSIKMKKSGVIIKAGEFKILGDRLFVCDFLSGLRFFHLSQIQNYLGIALSCLSVICLLFTIITYIRIREMQTIAGKMTAMLSLYLLIGQILVMVKVEQSTVCMVIAIVNHFVWLSVFCWMSVIAFNMALTFWKTALVTTSDSQKRFKRFVAFCFILPGIIVGTCVGLEYSSIESRFQADYGQVSCCWMSHMEGIVIMFYVPVGISLLFNIVCFALTLFGIERSLKAASIAIKENGRSERKTIVIYAKLSSVMGFTWVIGFLAALVEHEALWYIYVILNGLQGTFIFLAFICNRRTMMLLGLDCLFDRSESYIKSSNEGSNTQNISMKDTRS